MAGHVNMMDDYLIANLPPPILRSALRLLISQGAITQKPFVEHVRARFRENPPTLRVFSTLFTGNDGVTSECSAYVAQIRCMFSCKMSEESIPHLEQFVNAIYSRRVSWSETSEVAKLLTSFDGDIVQAIQALKETDPPPTAELLITLNNFLASLKNCAEYCSAAQPRLRFPFARGRQQLQDAIRFLFPQQRSTSLPPTPPEPESEELASLPGEIRQAAVETFRLGPFEVPRLFNGLWQLSSASWGSATTTDQERALTHAAKCGLTAADMADHYGDAELVYGVFRNKFSKHSQTTVFAATKWCVFSPIPKPVTAAWVSDAVCERSRRLKGRVELLQFHWYDYTQKEYLDVLAELVLLTKTCPTTVSAIGLCNFDSAHLAEACEHLIARFGEVGLVSNQVQFSLVDARPLRRMTETCEKYGLKLLTYGTLVRHIHTYIPASPPPPSASQLSESCVVLCC